jgi:hypothetical protein
VPEHRAIVKSGTTTLIHGIKTLTRLRGKVHLCGGHWIFSTIAP